MKATDAAPALAPQGEAGRAAGAPPRPQGEATGECTPHEDSAAVDGAAADGADGAALDGSPSAMVNGKAAPAALANGQLRNGKLLDSLSNGTAKGPDDKNLPSPAAAAKSNYSKLNGSAHAQRNGLNGALPVANGGPTILIIEKDRSANGRVKDLPLANGASKPQDAASTDKKAGSLESSPTQGASSKVQSPVNGMVNGSCKKSPELNEQSKEERGPAKGQLPKSGEQQSVTNGQTGAGEAPAVANGQATASAKPSAVNGQAEAAELAALNGPAGGKAVAGAQRSVNGFALMKGVELRFGGDGDARSLPATNGDAAAPAEAPAEAPEGGAGGDGGGLDPEAEASWDRAVAGVKEQAFARLQEELRRAHQELKLRDEEVTRLSRIREEVEAELEELTASLFQEAHNMVREANVRQAAAERSFKESQMQVEVLTAEVAALKTLVLTSTPSRPNPHLHPQIDPRNGAAANGPAAAAAGGGRARDDAAVAGVSLFNRKHRRSPSHFNLKYGRENSPPESPVKEQRPPVPTAEFLDSKDGWEVDPNIHKEFVNWKQSPKFDKTDPFLARIYKEDINLCLDFSNAELGAKVQEAIEEGNIFIEAVSDKSKTVFPKKCALLEAPRQCHYRMKLGDQEQWYYISQICRNRVTAVCDFLNYLRYIERGLVKSSVHDVYWEITRLRKEMILARLGLALST